VFKYVLPDEINQIDSNTQGAFGSAVSCVKAAMEKLL
jgi:hypothetical protein